VLPPDFIKWKNGDVCRQIVGVGIFIGDKK
jgi:hypothetical protein